MKHFLFFCCLLLLAIDLKAQPILQGGTETTDSLLARVSAEISNVNPVRALELATEALSLSRNIGYSKGKAMSCFYIGQVLSYLDDYQRSIEYLSLSEQERYSRDNAVMQSEISRIKGQVYYMLNLNKASFHELQKAHEYAIRIKDKKERDRHTSLAYENLGIAYDIIKQMPDSSFYWMKRNEKLLTGAEEKSIFRNKINLYSHFGEYYTGKQQYNTAALYFEKADSLIRQYDYHYSSWLYQRWGDLQRKRGNNDSAMILYRNGLENLKTTNIKNELPGFYKRISEIYAEREEEDSARQYHEKELQISNELGKARNAAAEEAFAMLLREEQKLSKAKLRRTISLVAILFTIVLSVSIVIVYQSIIRRKKKESEVSELKLKLNDAFEEVIELARKNESSFLPRFREVYPEFSRSLLQQHPNLTNTELRLSAMIFLHFPSKEIAEYMFITHRSVQTSKSRLRKKLDIPSDTDLYSYFKTFS